MVELTAVSAFFEYSYAPFVALELIVAVVAFRRRFALLAGLFLVLILVTGLKPYYAEPRPCVLTPGVIDCPGDFGLPSGHAATSTIFAVGALGTPLFWLFAPLAIVVSYTRIFAGVHTLTQVASGVALAVAAYAAAMEIRLRVKHRKDVVEKQSKTTAEFEDRRQFVHIAVGISIVLVGLAIGKEALEALLLAGIIVGFAAAQLVMSGAGIKAVSLLLSRFERKGVVPFRGAVNYAAGALLIITLSGSYAFALGVIAMLAVGDGFSTIIGKRIGRTKLPWNKDKSLEGLCAFWFGAGFAAMPFLGPAALLWGLVLAVIESLPIGVDDNITIPAAALVLKASGLM